MARTPRAAGLAALLLLLTAPAVAQDGEDLRAQVDALQRTVQALREELDQALQERGRLCQELDEQRQERSRLQDQLIEGARKRDQDVRQLQVRLEESLRERVEQAREAALAQARLSARLELMQTRLRDLEGGSPATGEEQGPPADPLAQLLPRCRFEDQPLAEVARFVSARAGLPVELASGLEQARVTLEVEGRLSLGLALELVACNARGADGAPLDLTIVRSPERLRLEPRK